MQTKRPDRNEPPRSRGVRHAPLLLLCLLLTTLAGGLAARQLSEAAPITTTTSEGPTLSSATAGPVHFSGRLDRGSVLQGSDGLVKFELVMRADDVRLHSNVRVPTDLIVIFDRSGSMQGEPLEQAVASVRELISGLTPDDRFALVAYSDGAQLVLPLAAATAPAVQSWQSTLTSLQARGGTNMAAGLDLAAQVASERASGRSVRALLLSDGHANQGDYSHEGLRSRAARAVASEAVLSAVGIGDGFDEHLMSTLADAGTGNFYYVRSGQGLAGVFAGEFAAARETVASSLQVEIAPAAGVELVDAAGYPLLRARHSVSFQPGPLFAGQERRVWLSFRAPTDRVSDAVALGQVKLRYVRNGAEQQLELPTALQVACVADEQRFFAEIDREAWAQSVMVDDYNALRSEVSRLMQKGERAPAAKMIEEYRAERKAMNDHVQSEPLARQLDSLEELRRDVDEAFASSPMEVNQLGKKLKADSIDGRRVGAKK